MGDSGLYRIVRLWGCGKSLEGLEVQLEDISAAFQKPTLAGPQEDGQPTQARLASAVVVSCPSSQGLFSRCCSREC